MHSWPSWWIEQVTSPAIHVTRRRKCIVNTTSQCLFSTGIVRYSNARNFTSSTATCRRNHVIYAHCLHHSLNIGRSFSSNAEVEYADINVVEGCTDHRCVPHESVVRKEFATAPHCRTCTCGSDDNSKHRNNGPNEDSSLSNREYNKRSLEDHGKFSHIDYDTSTCHLKTPLFDPNTPMSPPLPDPRYSFRKRVLPSNLTAFTSKEGKIRFIRALTSNFAEAYYPLSQQFINQSDPAYCGITTLVVVLNALAMDPNVRWRGGWRWYGDESMLLDHCCLEEERVAREGISIEMFGGLARCQGVKSVLKRPVAEKLDATLCGIDEFRNDIINAVRMPPETDVDDRDVDSSGGYFVVTSFSRRSLNQTGDGHFSPVAAYDPETDSCLVLDVARFKYAPYWVTVQDLYDAMIPHDAMTDKSRGWILMYPPDINRRQKSKTRTVEEMEGKRLAGCVPLAGSGMPLCPMENMKKEYCAITNSSRPRTSCIAATMSLKIDAT